jgi:dUTP pyrophosphatase
VVGAGVIDPDDTGDDKVVLFNHGDKDFEVKKGDRIAQLVLERCETPPVKEIEIIEETDRGSGGFGSTGN